MKSHSHNGLCIGQCKTHHSWTIAESTSSLLICAREPLAIIFSIFSLLTKWYSTPSWPLALTSTWSLKTYSERSTWTYARLKSSRETIPKKIVDVEKPFRRLAAPELCGKSPNQTGCLTFHDLGAALHNFPSDYPPTCFNQLPCKECSKATQQVFDQRAFADARRPAKDQQAACQSMGIPHLSWKYMCPNACHTWLRHCSGQSSCP